MAEDRSSYRIDIKTSAEGSEKIHEVKEALHLVKFEAEGALGPVGELIRLISNPWVFAIAGLTAAYRLWNEQLEKERENLAKNIALSREQTELFRNAHIQALRDAADAANKYAIEQKHAADNVDLLTESMKRSIDFAKEMKSLTDANASSVDVLTQSWIKFNLEAGKLTDQGANALLGEEAKKLRAQKEASEDAETQAEIDAKSGRAGAAQGQSRIAAGQIPGLEDQRATLDEHKIIAERLQAAADKLHDALAKASDDAAANARTGPGAGYILANPVEARNRQEELNEKARKAKVALKQNESVSRNQESVADKLAHQIAEIDADIEAAKKLRDSRAELARTLEEEAAESRDRLTRSKAARSANDQNADQAGVVDRLSELHKKITGGNATPGEQAEYSGAQSKGTINQQWKTILDHIDVIRNEGPGAERQADLDQVLGQIIGMLEFLVLHPGIKNAEEIARRLNQLENSLKNNRYSP